MANSSPSPVLSRAWDLFWDKPVFHLVSILIVGVVASLTFGLLKPALLVGYFSQIEIQERGGHPDIGGLFQGFDRFVPALVAGVLSVLAIAIGYMLCIVPGLMVAGLLPLSILLVQRGETDGVRAVTQAWNLIRGDLLSELWFTLMMGLVILAGFLAFGIGALVSLPVATAMIFLRAKQRLDGWASPVVIPAP